MFMSIRTTLLSLCTVLLLAAGAVPQASQAMASETEEEKVRAVIDALFDAMRAGDGEAAAALFHESATLGSAYWQDGTPVLNQGTPAERFVAAIGQPHEEVWDEHIWDVEIHVDDNLAVAWMDYSFFLGDTFSHCGVNAFQFFRTEDGWKITNITDTRRSEGCERTEK